MAGLLDSARDFERWLADLESRRPISHPQPLDVDEMYRRYLEQKLQQATPAYQAAQWPAALREASAVMPWSAATQAQPRAPASFASPTLQPPQEPFANRMTGPASANLEDRRTPITADTVANWLRTPYSPDDQYWKW